MQKPSGLQFSLRTIAAAFVFLAASDAAGQQAASRNDELLALVANLELIQQANLSIAQEIAAIHVSAAVAIRSAAAAGAFTEEAMRLEALSVAENSAILAVVILAPIGTRAESRRDPFRELLSQNVARLDALLEQTADDGALSVLREAHSRQLETQSIFARLDDSWADYDDALRRAELAGTLSVGSYDPRRRHWEFPSAKREAGTGPDESVLRLPQDAAAVTPAASGSDRWNVTTDGSGRPAATALNLDDPGRGRLASITISCNIDGTLRYRLEGDGSLAEIAIVFGDTERALVAVEQGSVVGGQALRMSDSLRLAYEWAVAKQSPTMAIGTPSDPSFVAALPISNYYEARGAVLDSCEPHEAGPTPAEETSGSAETVAPPIPFPRPKSRMPGGA